MKGAQRRQPAGSGCSQQHVPLPGLKSPPGMIYPRCSSCRSSPGMAPAPAPLSRSWWSGSPRAVLRSPQRWEGAAGVTQKAHEVSVRVSCLYVVRNWMVLFLPPLCRRQNNSSVSFEPQYPQYHRPASRRPRRVLRGDRSPHPRPARGAACPGRALQPLARETLIFPAMPPAVTQICRCLLPVSQPASLRTLRLPTPPGATQE